MNCSWSLETSDGTRHRYRCERCGLLTNPTSHPPEKVYCQCRAYPRWHEFGHWAALLVGELGVTRHRYVAAKKLLGLQPKCGCQQREAAMNAWGGRVKWWLDRLRKRPDPPPPEQRRAGEG